MKKRAGLVRFLAVTVVLVMVAAYFCVETVKCQVDVESREVEMYYREKEAQLVKEVREFLNAEGFTNGGVMLTKVVDVAGAREYTLTVHHGKIDEMSEEERAILLGKMQQLVFSGKDVSFYHEFLLNP